VPYESSHRVAAKFSRTIGRASTLR
jgi:hypothetical protein